ncbi:hypothetical protein BH10PSE19_BH10PSE19_12610 [soil metagenome]
MLVDFIRSIYSGDVENVVKLLALDSKLADQQCKKGLTYRDMFGPRAKPASAAAEEEMEQDLAGFTPMHAVIISLAINNEDTERCKKKLEIFDLLLEAGAHCDGRWMDHCKGDPLGSYYGNTPLELTIRLVPDIKDVAPRIIEQLVRCSSQATIRQAQLFCATKPSYYPVLEFLSREAAFGEIRAAKLEEHLLAVAADYKCSKNYDAHFEGILAQIEQAVSSGTAKSASNAMSSGSDTRTSGRVGFFIPHLNFDSILAKTVVSGALDMGQASLVDASEDPSFMVAGLPSVVTPHEPPREDKQEAAVSENCLLPVSAGIPAAAYHEAVHFHASDSLALVSIAHRNVLSPTIRSSGGVSHSSFSSVIISSAPIPIVADCERASPAAAAPLETYTVVQRVLGQSGAGSSPALGQSGTSSSPVLGQGDAGALPILGQGGTGALPIFGQGGAGALLVFGQGAGPQPVLGQAPAPAPQPQPQPGGESCCIVM